MVHDVTNLNSMLINIVNSSEIKYNPKNVFFINKTDQITEINLSNIKTSTLLKFIEKFRIFFTSILKRLII